MKSSHLRILRYVLAFMVLTPLWIMILKGWIRPEALDPEASIGPKLGYYVLPISALLIGVFEMRSPMANMKEPSLQRNAIQEQDGRPEAADHVEKACQNPSLEVLGLGLTVEMFRQTWIWEAISQPPSVKAILLEDLNTFPWSREENEILNRQRAGTTLAHALGWFVKGWPIPVFVVGPALREMEIPAADPSYLIAPRREHHEEPRNRWVDYLQNARRPEGIRETEFTVVEILNDDMPEECLDRIFEFMETHPDVPAVLLFAHDGNLERNNAANMRVPAEHGHGNPGELTESFTALVLARRDRVEASRDQLVNNGSSCDALTPFWDRPALKPVGAFQESKFMPRPWTREQFRQFDQLPVLGYLHHPQNVSFLKEGKLASFKDKVEVFTHGWNSAIGALQDGEKPTRVIFDCGPGREGRVSPLIIALDDLEPHLDVRKPAQGVDLSKYLGDIGANSFFIGTVLGIIASHRHNDVSAIVSFRKNDAASILLVSPPTSEERRKKHPGGKDPLNLELAAQELDPIAV